MGRIWLVRESTYDVSAAHEHGDITVIFDRVLSPLNVEAQARRIRDRILPAARPDDFILTSGPSMMIAVLSSLWLAHFGVARFLTYDRSSKRFICKEVRS